MATDTTGRTPRNRRSLIVCSALADARYDALLRSGADVVCMDLEDGTSLARKAEARDHCLHRFAEPPVDNVIRALRINSPHTLHGLRDLVAVAELSQPPEALLIPKVGNAEDLRLVADILDDAHIDLELIPLIEDQAGVRNARAIASASERVSALFLGSVDLSGELRSNMGWDALLKARQCVVEAGSEFGLDCIDGPWLDADDLEGLQIELGRLAAMGFTGKASYDIQQIAAIHSAFTPSTDEVALARRIIVAVTASDTGAARVDGKSVNKANAKAARRLLALAQRRGVVESN